MIESESRFRDPFPPPISLYEMRGSEERICKSILKLKQVADLIPGFGLLNRNRSMQNHLENVKSLAKGATFVMFVIVCIVAISSTRLSWSGSLWLQRSLRLSEIF